MTQQVVDIVAAVLHLMCLFLDCCVLLKTRSVYDSQTEKWLVSKTGYTL